MMTEVDPGAQVQRVADLSFLIVGTPRSGTTLVQRLASELPGVRVPPETHFFSLFARGLLRRQRFPLDTESLRDELERFLSMPASRGLELNPDAIVSRLAGVCARALDLFLAIVQELGGPAEIYGEKTPNHLLWWKPLTRAIPKLRIVAVVRDPRGVVNSWAPAPFGMSSHVALAERWVCDQRLVRTARRELGPDRCLQLRYEDVVADPESTQSRLREFLSTLRRGDGAPTWRHRETLLSRPLFMPWETWKSAALGPVVRDRATAWRQELTPAQARLVSRICQAEMTAFGYEADTEPRRMGPAAISPAERWRRFHFRVSRARRMRTIEAISL